VGGVSDSPPTPETAEPPPVREAPTWTPPPKPSFNSPAADLNQLRNEAKRIAESAPGQPVHKSVLDRARALASAIEHDLGLPTTPEGLSYADLAVLLSQSK
jgi:hypothetical protein